MSNIVKDFTDAQKFNPMGFDTAVNGSTLSKSLLGAVKWELKELPAALKTVDPTAAPPDETTGNIYILHGNASGAVHAGWDGAAKCDVVYFDGSLWQKITPVAGQTIYDKERNCLCKFNGTKWLYEECYTEATMSTAAICNSSKVDVATPITSLDILEPISCIASLEYGTADFTGAGFLGLNAESGTVLMYAKNAFLLASADRVDSMIQKDTEQITKGDKLQALTSANMATGDSIVKLFVKYRIVTT